MNISQLSDSQLSDSQLSQSCLKQPSKIKSSTVITATALHKSFGIGDGKVTAMNHLNIALKSGEMTLVKGPSGSGKSTIISALGGLQKPDSGQVISLGQDLWALKNNKVVEFRRNHCGYVFQSTGLFESLTAHQQILLPLQYLGLATKQSSKKADQLLEEVGLSHRRNARPTEMSGGENQRVAIARMLSKEPKLIFVDEPTSALDRKNGLLVADLLHQSAKFHNAMVLCVTHDDRLTEHADRILTIEDGRIIEDSANALVKAHSDNNPIIKQYPTS